MTKILILVMIISALSVQAQSGYKTFEVSTQNFSCTSNYLKSYVHFYHKDLMVQSVSATVNGSCPSLPFHPRTTNKLRAYVHMRIHEKRETCYDGRVIRIIRELVDMRFIDMPNLRFTYDGTKYPDGGCEGY